MKFMGLDFAQAIIWTKRPTPKNPATLVVGIVCSREDWGTWHRSMLHKGVNVNHELTRRPFTQEEREIQAKAYRLVFHLYKAWRPLIVDELRVTQDIDWILSLIEISREPIDVQAVIIEANMTR